MKGGNSKVGGYLPALRDLIYLDSASVCPPLPGTLQAMQDYYERYPFNYRVGVWSSSVELTELVDNIRKDIAEFIGASSENQVAFTKNTTEAINLVALGMRWRKGDEVVLTTVEHQSKLLIAGIVVAAVALIGFGGWYYMNSQDEKASIELGAATRVLEQQVAQMLRSPHKYELLIG